MKIPILISLPCVMALLCASLSCKPENNIRIPQISPGKIVSVNLKINSETSQLNTIPLTQKQNSDIIAIQIYTFKSQIKSAYARGLFSSLDLIPTIDLYDNQQYLIETSIVVNGQNLVAQRNENEFYRPFTIGTAPQKITNSFTYAPTAMSFLSIGEGEIKDPNNLRVKYARPLWARFAGYSEKFIPNTSIPISINARRVYAALKFRAEGLTSGKIEINLTGSPLIELTPDNNNRDTTIFISLAGSRENPTAWIEDMYTESIPCEISKINSVGDKVLISPSEGSTINIKRNHIHPITIQLNKTGVSIISIESGPMIEDDEIFY